MLHLGDGRQEVLAEGTPTQDGPLQQYLVKMRQSVDINQQRVDLRRWLHRFSDLVSSRLSGWKWGIQ
eukprot:4587303-Prorocentrum_lima.AAC.1